MVAREVHASVLYIYFAIFLIEFRRVHLTNLVIKFDDVDVAILNKLHV